MHTGWAGTFRGYIRAPRAFLWRAITQVFLFSVLGQGKRRVIYIEPTILHTACSQRPLVPRAYPGEGRYLLMSLPRAIFHRAGVCPVPCLGRQPLMFTGSGVRESLGGFQSQHLLGQCLLGRQRSGSLGERAPSCAVEQFST